MGAERFLLCYLLLILQLRFCASKDTITINDTLREGELLISKGKSFALGFFSPGNSRSRYLGIWYHNIPGRTVVWVANRGNPINGPSSGVLSLNQYGGLVLYNSHDKKVPVWSANVSVGEKDCLVAQLLDSGNLVLVQSGSKRIVWQGFDYPTDTLLQGMKVGWHRGTGLKRFLISWKSADDPGTGTYSYKLNSNGAPQFFLYNSTDPYWRSCPWPSKRHADLYGHSFVNNEEETYFSFFPDDVSAILRMKVEASGLLKLLTWHESEGRWKEIWSLPNEPCSFYGRCGPYSLCNHGTFSKFECACLPGYEPKSPRDWYLRDGSGGCIRKRQGNSSNCGPGDGFVSLGHVNMPDTSKAKWVSMNMTIMDCGQECLRNCSCTAYASRNLPGGGSGCLAWYGEITDTVQFVHEKYDLYIRVDAIELAEKAKRTNDDVEVKVLMEIFVPSLVSAWFVVVIFVYLWLKERRKRKKAKWNKRLLSRMSYSGNRNDHLMANQFAGIKSHPNLEFFKFKTISAATKNFCHFHLLGHGGFGSVYKGQLADGKEIAVKRLSKDSGQGMEEFQNEVMLIANLQHRNLVKLLGYCIEGEERMLVYEYMENKSLDSFLKDPARRSSLDWRKRFDIIVGIARGVLYLHQDSRLRIIHRDLKSSNILLDSELAPKISDFGMARMFKADQVRDNTKRVVGTYGYMSPEYAVFGIFSVKSDVFSFGIILLEIISGKKNNHFCPENPPLSLIGHVWELWTEDRTLEIVDPLLKQSFVSSEALRCIHIGLLCVQENAGDRPTMLTVLRMLNSDVALPPPKQPAFYFGASRVGASSPVMKEGSRSVNDVTITEFLGR